MNVSIVKAIKWIVLLSLLAALLFASLFYRYLTSPDFLSDTPLLIEIKPGTGFSRLAADLQRQGVISRPKWWTAYAVLTSQAEKVQAGEYRIEPGISPQQLLALFASGRVVPYQLTIVEGLRFSEMLATLAQQEKLEHRLAGLTPEQIMAQLGKPDEHPEGRFFPDSYQYVAGSSDLEILQRSYDRLQQVMAEEWQQRAYNLPYETSYEALIMASIIEKETGVPEEREQIAGVFIRRLQKGMRLQTDPTVIYGLGDSYQGDLKRKHLSERTPYNTYVIKGLPPTPIAMVGRAAIHAALHPAEGSSLYFVARGDGSHFFSDTLKQHQEAVRRFQIKQRSKHYQSAPQQKNSRE